MRTRALLAFVMTSATACAAALDVETITFEPPLTDAGCQPSGDHLADPLNCGRCGHDCRGGECVAGTCRPVTLLESEAELTSIVGQGSGLVVGRRDGLVGRIEENGTLGELARASTPIVALAADEQSIYWLAGVGVHAIERANADGGERQVLAERIIGGTALALGDDLVVVAYNGGRQIGSVPRGGGFLTLRWESSGIGFLAATSGNRVVWSERDVADGGAPEQQRLVASAPAPIKSPTELIGGRQGLTVGAASRDHAIFWVEAGVGGWKVMRLDDGARSPVQVTLVDAVSIDSVFPAPDGSLVWVQSGRRVMRLAPP